MVRDGVVMTTVAFQRDAVAESFRRLSPPRQYTFVLLLLERLLTICRETFPSGLPTKVIPYEEVDSALECLWRRVGTLAEEASIGHMSKNWRPLTSTGHVEHRPGAAIGFHVSDLISRLSAVDLHSPMDGLREVAWEAMQSLLFRLPENPDYSKSFIHSELDAALNGALLLEYETQRAVLTALHESDQLAVTELREGSRLTAKVIADREHNDLMRS